VKPLTEQVDAFIESYFDGTFISGLADYVTGDKMITGRIEPYREKLNQLVDVLIPQYLSESEPSKKGTKAGIIYNIVLNLRTYGMIRSNPFSLKELNFYKDKCDKLEKETEALRTTVKESYDTIEKLQGYLVEEDKKKGSRTYG
jgi:hypothetical protein